MVKENITSKDNAVQFMGHSEKMFDKVYSHVDKKTIKELMKKQMYNFEYLPEEKKHKLEIEIEKQKKEIEKTREIIKETYEILKGIKKTDDSEQRLDILNSLVENVE